MVSLHAALALIVFSAAGQTVLLDFYSDSCPPCRAMMPVVQSLEAKGYPVQRINATQNPALARQFNVTNVPCFVMVADGREVTRAVGIKSAGELEQMCRMGLAQAGAAPGAAAPAAAPPGMPTRDPLAAAPPRMPSHDPLAATPPAAASPTKFAEPFDAPAAGNRSIRLVADERSVPLNNAAADDALLSATVRIRVADASGASKGTGTIIDARQGEALILTCAHIFRDSQGKGPVEVDLFGSSVGQRLPGILIDFDLKNDVALLRIRTPGAVKAARVAAPGYRVGPGDPVVNFGCSHGADPTPLRSRITAVDRYTNWPNLTIAGESVEGRSGGGLFTDDGLVVGVCNARDPQLREGLYSSLPAIHGIVDRNKLSFVYETTGRPEAALASSAPRALPLVPLDRPAASRGGTSHGGGPAAMTEIPVDLAVRPAMAVAELSAPPLNTHEQAAVDEIRRRLQDGAEVICIVRSRKDPAAKSEVIVLDKASPEFLSQLYAETRPQPARTTSAAPPIQETGARLPAQPWP